MSSGSSAAREAEAHSTGVFETLEEMPAHLTAWARQSDAAYSRLVRSGQVKGTEFTADMPARLAGQRLRRVLTAKGIKQSELAKRLGISPAVISRVLKNPDRSMVATLRRIAAAIGVELHELID
ncbi:MAG TPA: helix-turn-helix domain-containing protein [Phycisphaerae bacterium]